MVQYCHTERPSVLRYFKGNYFSCNMFSHKSIHCNRRNMKHVRCYVCNTFGHKAKEFRRKFRPPYQKEQTSSQSKVLKKKALLLERCGIAQFTDITDLGEVESAKLQYTNSHMQLL